MSKFDVVISSKFKRDLKLMRRRGYDIGKMSKVIKLLADGEVLPKAYKDHALTGNWSGYRECHITPDWLLIYKIEADILVLLLTRTGSHSDLLN